MKMNMVKKALIPAVVALSVLAPLSAFAADAAGSGGAGSSAVQSAPGKWERPKERIADQRQDRRGESIRQRLARSVGPHHVMYMELLAEKYLPSEETEWQTAFADRKQVLEELKQQHHGKGQGQANGGGQAAQTDREARRALREQFTKAVADQNADEIAAVLPKLLTQYEHDTDALRQRVQQPQPQNGQASQSES